MLPALLPMLKSVRIFISYSSEDRKTVGSLKESLEKLGFEVFIAHDDIKPRSEWQEEITRNLKRCDVFTPYLSKDFKNSKWTDQETGIAIAGGKLIISLQVDIPPYGFIGKYQSLKICRKNESGFDFDETAEKIANIIISDKKFKENMKEFAISALLSSGDFIEANTRVKLLKHFEYTDEEINRICEGVLNNSQIYGAFTAQSVLKNIVKKYRDVIKPEIYKEITEALSKGLEYLSPQIRKMLKDT